jgi:hypothetical protein
LVFVTTSLPFSTSGNRAKFKTIEQWSQAGSNILPEAVRVLPYTNEHRVTVLVYEFEKASDGEEPSTSVPGRYTVRVHLERSHLLANLQ